MQGIFGRQANISCLAAYTVYGAKVKNEEYDVQGAIKDGCPLRIYIIIMYIKQKKSGQTRMTAPVTYTVRPKMRFAQSVQIGSEHCLRFP